MSLWRYSAGSEVSRQLRLYPGRRAGDRVWDQSGVGLQNRVWSEVAGRAASPAHLLWDEMAEADASDLAHPGAVRAGVHVPGQVGDEVRGVQANRVRAEVPSWIQERLWDEVDVETVRFVAGVLWTALAYSAPRAGAPLGRTLWLQMRDRASGRIGRRAGQWFGLAAHQEVWRPVTTGVWGPLQEQVAEEVHDAHFAAARGR